MFLSGTGGMREDDVMTVTEVFYSMQEDKTYVVDVTYDLNENPIMEKEVGSYDGQPNESKTASMVKKGEQR